MTELHLTAVKTVPFLYTFILKNITSAADEGQRTALTLFYCIYLACVSNLKWLIRAWQPDVLTHKDDVMLWKVTPEQQIQIQSKNHINELLAVRTQSVNTWYPVYRLLLTRCCGKLEFHLCAFLYFCLYCNHFELLLYFIFAVFLLLYYSKPDFSCGTEMVKLRSISAFIQYSMRFFVLLH